MQRHKAALPTLLSVLWIFLVYLLFYSTQKPFTVETFLAFADSLLNVALALFILLLGTALGQRLLKGLSFASPGEELVFAAGIGLGILSLSTLGLGLLGLLYPWLFYALSLGLALLLLPQILSLLKRVIQLHVPSRPPLFIGLYLVATLSLSFLLALAPPISFDALLYHLVGPKLYIQEHRIWAVDNFPLYFPSLVEMLFTWGMLLKGDIVAKLIHYLYGLLAGAAVFLLAKRYLSSKVGWWSLALAWSMPMVWVVMGWAYADLGLVLYELLAFFALLNWLGSKEGKWLLLSGALSGFAMGVKYTGFVAPLSLALLILYQGVRGHQRASSLLRSLFLFTLLALLVASPWYLRNLYLVGNPFYPFIFGGKHWDHFLSRWYEQPGTGLGLSWRIIVLPLTVTLGTQDETFYDGRTGPLILALFPLLFLARLTPRDEKRTVVNYLLFLFLAQFVFWTWGVVRSQSLFQARLLLPGLVFLGIALAQSIEESDFSWPQFSLARFVTAVVTLALTFNLVTQTMEFLANNPLLYLAGLQRREKYLENNLGDHYRAMNYVNENLPDSAKIQFLWEPRTYYCQREARPDAILGSFKHLVFLEGEVEGIVDHWREAGITHVLFRKSALDFLMSDPEDRRFALSEGDQRIWEELVRDHFDPLYQDERDSYILYRLRE
ncbi:MAG: ArnT family glycosyltransferase [Anaerolineae bacterium]